MKKIIALLFSVMFFLCYGFDAYAQVSQSHMASLKARALEGNAASQYELACYFDSGIGGFTVYVSNILNIEPEGSAVRIISRDELGETTLQLDRHGAMHVSTVPYSKTTRIRE